MTPKEKAIDLFERIKEKNYQFDSFMGDERYENAKELSLLFVTEIILSNPHSNPFNNTIIESTIGYWIEVKKEIKKL